MVRVFRFVCFLVIIGVGWLAGIGEAAMEWQSVSAIDVGQTPEDVAVSAGGKWIYVLTKSGDILIYSPDGQLEETIHAGKQISFISPGPSDNQLLVGNGKENTVQMLSVTFIREIDLFGAPVLGPPDAPVTIVVFMDYQCPYCARLMPLLGQVLEEYSEQVRIAYKHYPLKMHKAAPSAAAASLVAAREDRFLELHALLVDDYKRLTYESILDKASSLGFDREAFRMEMASLDILKQIQKDIEDGKKAGVTGVPAVFINGKRLKNRSLKGFQQMIDKEIKTIREQPITGGQ